jgi:hypothetical protein
VRDSRAAGAQAALVLAVANHQTWRGGPSCTATVLKDIAATDSAWQKVDSRRQAPVR